MSENNILSLDEFTQGLEKAASGDGDAAGAEAETPNATERQSNVVVLRRICFDYGVKSFYPANVDGVFVRFPRNTRFEIGSIRSRRFRAWLSKKFLISQGILGASLELEVAVLLELSKGDGEIKDALSERMAILWVEGSPHSAMDAARALTGR